MSASRPRCKVRPASRPLSFGRSLSISPLPSERARERRRESGSGRREERSRHYSSVTACAKRDAGSIPYLCISPLSTAKGAFLFSHTTSSNHFMLSHCPPQSPFCCDIPCCGAPLALPSSRKIGDITARGQQNFGGRQVSPKGLSPRVAAVTSSERG